MKKRALQTDRAPAAIGTYSQAVRSGNLLFASGQIPLDPVTMDMVTGDIDAEVERVLENLKAVAEAAGATLDDAVKLNVYLLDMAHFGAVNAAFERYFNEPYSARAAIAVSELPRGARVEIDAIFALS